MAKILVIRDKEITAEIDQEEGQITQYQINGTSAITLLHEIHLADLMQNLSKVAGRELTLADFCLMIGVVDKRPVI